MQRLYSQSSLQCAALTWGTVSSGAVPGLQVFPGSRCSHVAQRVPSWAQPLRDEGWHPDRDTRSLPWWSGALWSGSPGPTWKKKKPKPDLKRKDKKLLDTSIISASY